MCLLASPDSVSKSECAEISRGPGEPGPNPVVYMVASTREHSHLNLQGDSIQHRATRLLCIFARVCRCVLIVILVSTSVGDFSFHLQCACLNNASTECIAPSKSSQTCSNFVPRQDANFKGLRMVVYRRVDAIVHKRQRNSSHKGLVARGFPWLCRVSSDTPSSGEYPARVNNMHLCPSGRSNSAEEEDKVKRHSKGHNKPDTRYNQQEREQFIISYRPSQLPPCSTSIVEEVLVIEKQRTLSLGSQPAQT